MSRMSRGASRALGLVGCLLAGLLWTGCFDVEQTLVLEKDLSGQAGFTMKVDMEPMVVMMLNMQRSMEGKEGAPTAAEIEKAKADFLANSSRSGEKLDPEKQKQELAKQLPAGVKLLDSRFEEKDLGMLASFNLGFDDVDKLKQVRLAAPKDAAEGAGAEAGGPPKPENPFDTPFGDLVVDDSGDTILLTTKPRNPLEEQKQEMGGADIAPDMEKQLEEAFKGLRIAWKIKAPFQVLEHNATRVDGKTLVWEYTLDSMKTMDPKKLAEGIRVRYKKS